MSQHRGWSRKIDSITLERLSYVLRYNPLDGELIWNVTLGARAKEGGIAGFIDPSTGYKRICIDGVTYQAHRLAYMLMMGSIPDEIDHINHVKHDNRWLNIREVSHKTNGYNQSISRVNKSGFNGVAWNKTVKKWQAYITVDKKQKHIGYYMTAKAASIGRKDAEKKYGFHKNHGERL